MKNSQDVEPTVNRRTYLLAGTRSEARNYCTQRGVNLDKECDIKYVDNIDQLLGGEHFTLVLCGTFSTRPDLERIVNFAMERGANMILGENNPDFMESFHRWLINESNVANVQMILNHFNKIMKEKIEKLESDA